MSVDVLSCDVPTLTLTRIDIRRRVSTDVRVYLETFEQCERIGETLSRSNLSIPVNAHQSLNILENYSPASKGHIAPGQIDTVPPLFSHDRVPCRRVLPQEGLICVHTLHTRPGASERTG